MAMPLNSKQKVDDSICGKNFDGLPVSKASNDSPHANLKDEEFLHEISDMAQDALANLQNLNLSDYEGAKGDCNKPSPSPLLSGGLPIEEVQANLINLIVQIQAEDRVREAPQLDALAKFTLSSHAHAAYVTTLETRRLRKLYTRLLSDCSLCISRIFKLFDHTSYFHDELREGLVKVCRMLLHSKYPKYQSDGFEALYSKPPVIYMSAAIQQGLGQHICTQLGLPHSSLTIVPCNNLAGSSYRMDISALEESITEDIKAARTPLIIVAGVGAGTLGHSDHLARLQEVSRRYELWLHLEGHCLAGLALQQLAPTARADSFTMPLGTWLGLPSLPAVTFFRHLDLSLLYAAGLNTLSAYARQSILPLWATLMALGIDGVVARIRQAFEISDYLLEKLEQTPKVKIISKERLRNKDGKVYSLSELNKSMSTTLLFDILVPLIVFQYVADDPSSVKESSSKMEEKISFKDPAYFDNLNSWIGQLLRKDWPAFRPEVLELDNHGICIRLAPIEVCNLSGITKKEVNEFYNYFLQQLEILTATVNKKKLFFDLVKCQSNLQLVHISNWAGLGGVRYIPETCINKLNELTDVDKEEINKLNSDLVMKLKSTDSAFSIGEGDDMMQCIRFGMVTEDLDVEDLVNLVASMGREMEESSKYLETMTEMVKQGIEEANKELEQENVEKFLQEGLLRHVPLVGNFYNWWAPQSKEGGIKGRSFNLTSGTVESTENIYKYHMQIQQGQTVGSVKTPAAQVIIKCDGVRSASTTPAVTTTTASNARPKGAQV